MKKIILTTLLMLSLICNVVLAESTEPEIKLMMDSKMIKTDTVTANDRTLIPLRTLMESTGAEVTWYDDTQKIDVARNGEKITLQIGNTVMNTVAGDVTMDTEPILHNGDTTYVPLRAICEAFDFTVDWDEGTKTILVLSPEGCPYVDFYDGMTLEEFWTIANGRTPESFVTNTGMDYESNKDKLYVEVHNNTPLTSVAYSNNMTTQAVKEMFYLDESVPDTITWGEMIGNLTFGQYIEIFTSAAAYGLSPEQALPTLLNAYGLGSEYTVDTKYKYVRPVIDNKELEAMQEQKRQEVEAIRQKEADLAALPGLCENKIYFTITLEDGSTMKGELYPDVAPITVENFVKLCNENFYDGLIFHRVIDGFMIQGGGYDQDFNQKPTETIKGEFYTNGVTNALKHERGVISMARTNLPDSASGQFFIVDEAAPHLDGSYAAFGRITSGLDVLDAIAETPTTTNELGLSDVPTKPIIMKSIRIEK